MSSVNLAKESVNIQEWLSESTRYIIIGWHDGKWIAVAEDHERDNYGTASMPGSDPRQAVIAAILDLEKSWLAGK